MSRLPRVILCVAASFIFSSASTAESDSSRADLPSVLDAKQTRNLFLAGKVWGYLKYHHPTVVDGCLNWDERLIQSIPAILDAADNDQVASELLSWIDELEKPDACKGVPQTQEHFGSRSNWLDDETLLGSGLADRLQSFDKLRCTVGQHYISQNPNVGTPVFQNELGFSEVDQLDRRHHLLAMYRFWNIVEYWFPYRDVIDENWDEVLMDSIPRFYAVDNQTDYLLELARLFARVDDGHASVRESIYVRPPGGRKTPPFSIRMVEGRPFIWRSFDLKDSSDVIPADQLQFGDVVLRVDGKSVEELFRLAAPYIGASNKVSSERLMAQFLLNGGTDSVDIRIERDGQLLDITNRRLPRESLDINVQLWHDRDGETFQLLSDEVAYLKLSTIDNTKTAEYIRKAAGTKGMVIDIRSYPSSFVVFALGQHLVSASTPFARFTRADLSRPGSFLWMEPMSIEPADPQYKGKIVILVDEDSQSQSEYTAMAFRAAPNAIVIGGQTAGADGNVTRIPLPGGYNGLVSGIGVFYPDKVATQRIGIVPDIEVRPTITGLRAGRDEVLEVGIRQILGKNTPDMNIREMAAFPVRESQR